VFKGEVFPKCASCFETVIFKVIQGFPGLDALGVLNIYTPLYELPVLNDEVNQVAERKATL